MREVNSAKNEPAFTDEVRQRTQRNPDAIHADSDFLRRMARLIAFSQNARSDLVEEIFPLATRGVFDEIFHDFMIEEVAEMDPDDLRRSHWHRITPIRFPRKLNSIVGCAKSLQDVGMQYGSFSTLLEHINMPRFLESEADIEQFWGAFIHMKRELTDFDMPFFKSSTSLLHFLLHIGFPCVKPDLILMRVAQKIGMVDSVRTERDRLRAVRLIQLYCLRRGMLPSVVDLCLLIFGGQKWARQFVCSSFYSH
jgi:3-methyladenine DNA glycosylase Tag